MQLHGLHEFIKLAASTDGDRTGDNKMEITRWSEKWMGDNVSYLLLPALLIHCETGHNDGIHTYKTSSLYNVTVLHCKCCCMQCMVWQWGRGYCSLFIDIACKMLHSYELQAFSPNSRKQS